MNGEKNRTSYEYLKDLILGFHIKHGQRITEVFLSEKMNLSRIPVREAIQQMVYEGFIERSEKNGYQIKEYNEQDIIDLYNYREAMDGMLVKLFTGRVDESQLYFLEINVESMSEILQDFDRKEFSKIDLEFHRIIARGARNQYMEHQHEIILEKVLYVAELMYKVAEEKKINLLDINSYKNTYLQHKAILESIKKRDPENAENFARESVREGLKKSLLILSKHR
ncbi:MAG: GntR family transcriptional regulator [Spirochaetaceae bacterium]